MAEPFELTSSEAARGIRSRELSPVELVESLLQRIDSLEPRLKAWVYVDREGALLEAKAKEAELTSGASLGPLHGVPVGLKDIYHNAGIPTTACSKVYADFVPDYDATTVAMMKRAGAIMLGKTVTTEFACLDPSPTINPWNPAHTPGGSSSGSAVAVAARMCSAAMGSQTVGSVLRPACFNGVVGFKPTFGRVSRYGVVPVSWSLDHVGWLVPGVEDAALMLQAMAGPDPNDPVSSLHPPTEDYLAALESPNPPRIGLARRYFYDHADTETRQHVDQVIERLERAGANVEEIPLPDSIESAFDEQLLIMSVELAAFHQPMFERQAEDYSPKLRDLISRGLSTDGISYSRALERRVQFTTDMHQVAEKVDVLLTPSTPTPSLADRTNTGDPKFQGPWTSCGLPAISIPSGLAGSGLPLGVQLAAAPFAEARLLAAARWCESVLDVHLKPPLDS